LPRVGGWRKLGAMRAAYRVLAMLVAIGVVVQVAVVAWGWFAVLHKVDDGGTFAKGGETAGMSAHGLIGFDIIPLIAFLLLIVLFAAKIPGGVKWALIVFGDTVLQVLLALLSGPAPVIGALHGINALALAAFASIAMRKARLAATDTGPSPVAAT
jgi:hypothetical protein